MDFVFFSCAFAQVTSFPKHTANCFLQVPALAGAAGDVAGVSSAAVFLPANADADGLGGSWQDLQQLRAHNMRVNALNINNQVSAGAHSPGRTCQTRHERQKVHHSLLETKL